MRRHTRQLGTEEGLPKWAQDQAESPVSKTSSLNSTESFMMTKKESRKSTASFRWAPEAFVLSWHGSLSETFDMVNVVGEGRSGTVAIVQHKQHEKCYACKFLRKHDHDSRALRSEITTLRRLDHPNIVRLYETHEDGDAVFLLMELCHGGDLFSKISEEHHLCESTAMVFAQQMLSALAYCHARGVVHRDIKPENFLLETDDPTCLTLKLADFGIATSIRPSHISSSLTSRGWSRSHSSSWPSVCHATALDGDICGSLPYMAPELFTSRGTPQKSAELLASSDLWSCGVTIYVMLCGRLPFGERPERICSGAPPEFSGEVWDGVSREAIDLVRRLLSVDAQGRGTAQEALAHEWFWGLNSPSSAIESAPCHSEDGQIDMGIADCAGVLLRSLRRWRSMPKLRRIVIAAIARRLEGDCASRRMAEAVYTAFGGGDSDVLRCDRLAEVLSASLIEANTSFRSLLAGCRSGSGTSQGELPRDDRSASPWHSWASSRSPASATPHSITGLHVRRRVQNVVNRFKGSPMSDGQGVDAIGGGADTPSPTELKKLVGALDGMKDGLVDYTLLVASMLPPEVYCDEQHILEVFGQMDIQKRGFISPGDLRVAVRSKDADLKCFSDMLAVFDSNGDGVLDLAEFRLLVTGA